MAAGGRGPVRVGRVGGHVQTAAGGRVCGAVVRGLCSFLAWDFPGLGYPVGVCQTPVHDHCGKCHAQKCAPFPTVISTVPRQAATPDPRPTPRRTAPAPPQVTALPDRSARPPTTHTPPIPG